MASSVSEAQLVAPDVVNPEVVHSLRRLTRAGRLSDARASTAVDRLAEGTVSCVPTATLVRDCWRLRHNLSAYDACYVALARALRCPLLTADQRLARAPELGVTVIHV